MTGWRGAGARARARLTGVDSLFGPGYYFIYLLYYILLDRYGLRAVPWWVGYVGGRMGSAVYVRLKAGGVSAAGQLGLLLVDFPSDREREISRFLLLLTNNFRGQACMHAANKLGDQWTSVLEKQKRLASSCTYRRSKRGVVSAETRWRGVLASSSTP
jgi:hypothetical protein